MLLKGTAEKKEQSGEQETHRHGNLVGGREERSHKKGDKVK